MIHSALALALLLAAVPATKTPAKKPSKPKLEAWLRVDRRVGMAPLVVHATVFARDPGKQLRCPVGLWAWGNGWYEEAPFYGCDPFGILDSLRSSFAQSREMTYRTPGVYRLIVVMHGVMADVGTSETVEVR